MKNAVDPTFDTAFSMLWISLLCAPPLAFLADSLVAPRWPHARLPRHVEDMGPGLTCRITWWGAVFTASGYTVHLFEVLPAASFLWREVATISVLESEGDPRDATCADALAAYRK